ncbi:MAG: S1C family serine protease, partial [Caldimonas sp.]
MKKTPLYSRSRRPVDPPEATAAVAVPVPAVALTRRGRLAVLLARHERKFWALALAVLALGLWYGNPALSIKAPLTLEQIDFAVRQSIEDKPLVSPATRAYEAIIPSVVRVVGLMTEGDDGSDEKERGVVERGVGSGVVIIDNGTILTNLHVVSGA